MSAGPVPKTSAESKVVRSLDGCAPKFRAAVEAAIAECNAKGLDAYVYESLRSEELQSIYYARGRTVIPPNYTVTNVKSAKRGWHFYGLAVDVISRSKQWKTSAEWNRKVSTIFKAQGLDWGGEWEGFKDIPHYQFGTLRKSPSDAARELYYKGGLQAVWKAVGAT